MFETVTPRQAKQFIIECLMSGLVPFLRSSPGMGKSSIYREVADDLNLALIDHRLSTSAPEDLSGLPRFTADGKAQFAPFEELFPVEDTPLPSGKDGWLIFLDEFNSCEKAVQAAAYKLILDKMTGQRKLHERTAMGAAGNLDTDRAITNPISTAMQSRVVHIEMEISHEEWLKDVALKHNWDWRIIAFLNQYPSKLMDFRPDHNDKTFCCPRTWEFMNRLVKDKEVTASRIPLYGGTITSGVGAEFVTFCDVASNIINVKDICANSNLDVPAQLEARWATIAHMGENITKDNIKALTEYASRFSMDFQILFGRMMLSNHPEFRRHPDAIEMVTRLSHYLND